MHFTTLLLVTALTVGPEIKLPAVSSANLFQPTPVAVAATGDGGFVLAWTASNEASRMRVRLARFDARGAMIGAPREVPTAFPQSRDGGDPSLAAFGAGFLVGWSEDCGMSGSTCGWLQRLSAQLEPASAAVPLGMAGAPVVMQTRDAQTVVAAGARAWPVNADGALGIAFGASGTIDALAINADGALAAATHTARAYTGCNFPGLCYQREAQTLGFDWFGQAAHTLSSDFLSQDAPALRMPVVASHGSGFLMVWFASFGERLAMARIAAPAAAPAEMRAPATLAYPRIAARGVAVASDDERALIVWGDRTLGRLEGAVVDADGAVQRLTIAASAPNVVKVGVAALAHGRFAVLYGDGVAAYARFVSFAPAPGRSRAIR